MFINVESCVAKLEFNFFPVIEILLLPEQSALWRERARPQFDGGDHRPDPEGRQVQLWGREGEEGEQLEKPFDRGMGLR